jgi:hypothetical protein
VPLPLPSRRQKAFQQPACPWLRCRTPSLHVGSRHFFNWATRFNPTRGRLSVSSTKGWQFLSLVK